MTTSTTPPRPERRGYFNQQFQAHARKVSMGEHRIGSRSDLMLVTTLGSCVSACIHDPEAGIGGMNHFLLPDLPAENPALSAGARYGSVAMERLINALLTRGARRDRLQVKVFGGASVIESRFDVGLTNARFVLDYLDREGLTLLGQDLGGTHARRVHFFPHTGRAVRRLLKPGALPATVLTERRFRSALRDNPPEGGIDLFEEG